MLLNVVDSFVSYASIVFIDFATPMVVTGIGTSFVKGTMFDTNGPSKNCIPDHANDRIQVPLDGVYEVACASSFGDGNNVTFDVAVFAGPIGATVETTVKFKRKLGNGGDVGVAMDRCHLALNADDVVELYFKSDGTNKQAEVYKVGLYVRRIG